MTLIFLVLVVPIKILEKMADFQENSLSKKRHLKIGVTYGLKLPYKYSIHKNATFHGKVFYLSHWLPRCCLTIFIIFHIFQEFDYFRLNLVYKMT